MTGKTTEPMCILEPMIGTLIVRRKDPEQTAGGVIIPETQREQAARFFVVRASPGYMEHGKLIETALEAGDEVVLAANGVQTLRLKDGSEHRIGTIRHCALPPGLLPSDHFLVLQSDVMGRVPKDLVRPVLGAPNLAVVKAEPAKVH